MAKNNPQAVSVTEFEEKESGRKYWKSGHHDVGFEIGEGFHPFPDRVAVYEVKEHHVLEEAASIDDAVFNVV